MNITGRIFIAVGLMISVVSACLVDSPDPYGTLSLLLVAIGGVIAGAGYGICMAYEKRKERTIHNFFLLPREDKLDGDIEFIELHVSEIKK